MTKLQLEGARPRRSALDARATTMSSLRRKLMFAASASIISLALPETGLYGSQVFAQALPAGCSDAIALDASTNGINDGDGIVEDGETIECVSNPAGSQIGPIITNIDDLTVIIGDGESKTVVVGSKTGGSMSPIELYPAIELFSEKSTTLILRENTLIDSAAEAEFGAAVNAALQEAGDVLTIKGDAIDSPGAGDRRIRGAGFGILAETSGADVEINDLTSVYGVLLGINVASEGGDISIRNIREVYSKHRRAIFAVSTGSGESDGDISIQNIAVPTFDDDEDEATPNIRSGTGIYAVSGAGDINIGAEDPENLFGNGSTAIGDIYVNNRAILSTTTGGDTLIRVDGKIDVDDEAPASVPGVDVIAAVAVINDGATGLIDVSLASVSSALESAISISNSGDGDTKLTLEGAVSAPSDKPTIEIGGIAGASVTIAETGSVDANGGDTAIDFIFGGEDIGTDDTMTLYGSIVSGNVLMGDGADTFDYGGTLGDGVTVYGGDGIDTLRLISTAPITFSDTIGANGAIQEFENLSFLGSDTTLTGTHNGWQQVTFETGSVTALDGSLDAANGVIEPGAILNARDGAFFLGNLTNSGTINIGSSPGQFSVSGDFVQTSTGLLPIEIFWTSYDQLLIDGTATLGGQLDLFADLANLPENDQSFDVLIADLGILGTFETISDNLPDLDFSVITGPNTVTVTYVAPAVEDPEPDPNPGGDGGAGEAPTPDPEPLLSAKEIVPSGLSVAMRVNDMFVENLIQRRAVQLAPDQWSFWSAGFGGKHDVGVDDGTPGWAGDTSGLALGVERLIDLGGAPVLFGAAGGCTEASITSDASHSDVESYHLGAFANADLGSLFLGGSLAYAWQDYGFERAITSPSSATLAYGETEGTGWALKSEAFYDLTGEGASFGPVATFGSTITEYEGFKETDAGILNLNWSDETAYQTVIGLGGEGGFEANLKGLTVDTGLRILYESVGGDRDLQTRAFLDVPGAQFKPRAAGLDAERVALSFDTKLHLTKGLFAHVRYDTTRGDNLVDHEGWAGITLRF